MRITNKNIHWWLVAVIFLLWCYSMWAVGLPLEGTLTGIELLNLIGLMLFMIIILGMLGWYLVKFFYDCIEDNIRFDIDLLKPFRSRHVSPEEQDKENK